jgi:sodium transport system permease protein
MPWHLWVPGLAQTTLMGRVLKGDPLGMVDMVLPVIVGAAVTLLCLAYVARMLRAAAAR